MTASITNRSVVPFLQPQIRSLVITRTLPNVVAIITRHRASTRMYSLTFCVRVMSPERHHLKPAVQAAAVMFRTPPSTAGHRPACHAHFPYTARNFENAPVTRLSLASSARTPGRAFALSRDGRKLVTRVRVMLP